MDCTTGEDESNCTYVSFEPSYIKTIMPKMFNSKTNDYTMDVKINISILAFPAIDTTNLVFTADFVLNLRWYDDRLILHDLNNVSVLNTLNEDIVDQLWKPKLTFVNALGPFQTKYDKETYAFVVKQGEPNTLDMTQSKEGDLRAL